MTGFQNEGDNEITGIHVSDGDPGPKGSSAAQDRSRSSRTRSGGSSGRSSTVTTSPTRSRAPTTEGSCAGRGRRWGAAPAVTDSSPRVHSSDTVIGPPIGNGAGVNTGRTPRPLRRVAAEGPRRGGPVGCGAAAGAHARRRGALDSAQAALRRALRRAAAPPLASLRAARRARLLGRRVPAAADVSSRRDARRRPPRVGRPLGRLGRRRPAPAARRPRPRQAARLPTSSRGSTFGESCRARSRRCLQTVEPLAAARGIPIEAAAELADDRHEIDGPPFLRTLLGQHAVACVHGGIEDRLGIDLPFPKERSGSSRTTPSGSPRVLEASAAAAGERHGVRRRRARRAGVRPRLRGCRRGRSRAAFRAGGRPRAGSARRPRASARVRGRCSRRGRTSPTAARLSA